MLEFDVKRYREIRESIQVYEDELHTLQKKRGDMEAEIFKQLDMGQTFQADEFKFIVREGQRRLYPLDGFEVKWNDFIHSKGAEAEKSVQGLIKEQISYKGPTLAKMEKLLTESDFIRENWEEIMDIFGFRKGSRMENVKVIEEQVVENLAEDQGVYCKTSVVGSRYKAVPWDKIGVGDKLDLVREPENPVDENAVAVVFENNSVGYVPTGIAQNLAPMIDGQPEKIKFKASVTDITAGYKGETIKIAIYYQKLKGVD